MSALVHMDGIVKRYGDVVANDGITLDVSAGEVHALLGENGAGKTTLMNVLYGLVRADDGEMRLDGQMIAPRSPAEAIGHGIGMVHQHPLLVGRLTVAENLRLGGVGDGTPRGMRAALAGVERTFPLEVDPRARVDALPMSVRQRVEIVRCLARGVRVLILDEPTAVLTPEEVEPLFREIRVLADGGCSVIFITHKLGEVRKIAQRVTVLRHGRNVGTFATYAVSSDELTRLMVGRTVNVPTPRSGLSSPRRPVLELDRCVIEDEFGHHELHDLSLTVGAGEIVCIAGVEGNGQRPLAEVLFGLRSPTAGAARFEGRALPPVEHWRRQGVAIARIPEDRRGHGLVQDAPLWRNLLTGPLAPRLPGLLRRRALIDRAGQVLAEYGVVPPDPLAPASALSGGNQQKILLARELSGAPRALVAVNPTRGLDVGAQLDVYQRLEQLREQEMAVLVISTDLDEVERLADRIGVLYRGKLHGPFERDQTDRQQVGRLMAGASAESTEQIELIAVNVQEEVG